MGVVCEICDGGHETEDHRIRVGDLERLLSIRLRSTGARSFEVAVTFNGVELSSDSVTLWDV